MTKHVDLVVENLAGLVDGLEDFKSDYAARLAEVEKKLGRPGVLSVGTDTVTRGHSEERKALGQFVSGDEAGFRNTLQVSEDPAGGYIVLPSVSKTMTKRRFDYSPMHRLSRMVTIKTGDAFEEPTDFSDVGAVWAGELQARPATDPASLGRLRVPLNEIYSLQPVSQKLLDTSYLDIGSWLEGKISDRFARTEAQAAVTGDGIQKPKGFLSYPTSADPDATRSPQTLQHVVSGAATSIAADGIKQVYWALRSPHRGNASWLMASETANLLDRLKTGDGSYIWRSSMTAGAPNELLGRPVEFSEDMPTTAAGTFPIAFGDFKSGYLVVDQEGTRLLRDPYSSKPMVLIYMYKRTGGQVANTDAIKLMKIAAS